MSIKKGILLINLGTPSAPTPKAVGRFLSDFLHDYRVVDLPRYIWCPILHFFIIPFRSRKVAKLYRSIWMEGGSPLMVYSIKQTESLAIATGLDVELGMSYGKPSISDAVESLLNKGVEHIKVIPLYPQFSSSTVSSVWDAFSKSISKRAHRFTPSVSFVNDYADNPDYISALVVSIKKSFELNGVPDALLISYHGIPVRFCNEGDVYKSRCELTTNLIKEGLNLPSLRILMTFQSRFGREPWLTPFTDETIANLPSEGVMNLQVISPGFASDCLETLEELGEQNREIFKKSGGKDFVYIPALNDSPEHIKMLIGLSGK